MRIFELLLSITAIIFALSFFLPKIPMLWKERILPILLGMAALAQIGLEGFRWQLWPLFLAAPLLILLAVMRREGRGRRVLAGLAGLLILVSVAGAVIFPVPDPYPMTGPYQIGTRVVHLIDPNREEIYGENNGGPREFTAQVWYPAAPGPEDQRALWMPEIEYAAPAIAGKLNLPAFALGHLKHVRANAFLEAKPVGDGNAYPVLIFSHGWEGFKEQNIYQVEELASHGYVVIGLSHTYGSVITVFPDGRQMPTDQNALPDGVSDEAYDRASNRLVKQWAGDISWTLDELEDRNLDFGDWPLSDMVDLDRIGLLGHSTGGGAAVEFCLIDDRCQALLGMDIWAEPALPEILALRLTQPTLSMLSESWYYPNEPDRNYELLGTLAEGAESGMDEIALMGTRHYDFTSLPMLTPLAAQLGLKGPIPGTLGLEIINAESVAFFDKYLKGEGKVSLEEISDRYPESIWIERP